MIDAQAQYQQAALRLRTAEDRCRSLYAQKRAAAEAVAAAKAEESRIHREYQEASKEAGQLRDTANELGQAVLEQLAYRDVSLVEVALEPF